MERPGSVYIVRLGYGCWVVYDLSRACSLARQGFSHMYYQLHGRRSRPACNI
jgi:hypothetical protein